MLNKQRITANALTFDDVLLKPAYSEVLPSEVSLTTRLTKEITLNIPLVAAAMDTVTNARLAIAIAQEGGIGIVHRNLSIQDQADEVQKVKKFEAGIIRDPITIGPSATVANLIRLMRENSISGVPVVNQDELVGIVTSRDIRFETNMDLKVSDVMTQKQNLITAPLSASFETFIELLQTHRIEKVLLTNGDGKLAGMVTVKDIQKASDFPMASKDKNGSLRVGGSVGTSYDDFERVDELIDAGVDVVVVDTAHGHSKNVLDRVSWIRQKYPNMDIIAGNVATADGARALVDAGADCIKIGMGPGSICTTRIVAGIGVPQITAVDDVVNELANEDVPVIADGGIRYSGDIAKAIAAGAESVMLGSLFAGTDEAPGEVELYQGRAYKSYRGMGSQAAMQEHPGSRDRYFQNDFNEGGKLVPEGIEGRVPYRGPVRPIVHQLVGGLRAAMGYTGSSSITDLRNNSEFLTVSNASLAESHVHDVTITKEAPNYRVS